MAWYAINKWSSQSNCNDCPDEYNPSNNSNGGCCPVSLEAIERNLVLTLANGTIITGENVLPIIPNNGQNTFLANQFDFDEENKILNLYLNNDLDNPQVEIQFPESFFNGSNTVTYGNGITLNTNDNIVELGGTLTKNTTIVLDGNNLDIGNGNGRVNMLIEFFSIIIPNVNANLVRSIVFNTNGIIFGTPIFIGTHASSENQNLEVTPQGEIVRVVKDTSGLKITPVGPGDGTNISEDFVAYYEFNIDIPTITKNRGETIVDLFTNRLKSVTMNLDANNLKTVSSSSYKITIQNLPSTHYPKPTLELTTFTGTQYQIDYTNYSYKYITSGSVITMEITFGNMFPSEKILRGLKIELA